MSNISKCKICNCHDYINEYINVIHVQKLETSLNWYPILPSYISYWKDGKLFVYCISKKSVRNVLNSVLLNFCAKECLDSC